MKHFNKHVVKQGEFGDLFKTPEEYEDAGKSFMNDDISDSDSIVEATKKGGHFDGMVARANGLTGEFGLKSAGGTLMTYFKPVNLVEELNNALK
jgi:hypothetical protein